MKVLALMVLGCMVPALAADMEQSRQIGKDVGQVVRDKYGGKSKLQQNLQSPLFGQGTMKTVDDSQSFNAQLECPSTEKFLTISVLPLGTGDIRLLVKQDTNFDGEFDYSLDSEGLFMTSDNQTGVISGVCGNGVIVCKPGTWNYCTFWKWKVQNGKLSFVQLQDIKGLGGCYCINSSCGNIVWNAMDNILSSLGGGAVGAINEGDTRVVVSRSELDAQNLSVSYYGQDSKNCNVVNGETKDVEKYYSTGDIPSDEERIKELNNPESPYYSLMNSQALRNVSVYTCEIRNIPSLKPADKEIPCSNVVSIFGKNYCYIGRSQTVSEGPADLNAGTIKLYPAQNIVGRIVRDDDNCRNNYKYIEVYKGGALVHRVEDNNEIWACGPGANVWTAVVYQNNTPQPQTGEFMLRFYVHDNGKDDADIHLEIFQKMAYKDDDITVQSSGECSPAANCKLKEEQVCDLQGHCVHTIVNFSRTGIEPLPQCTTLNSSYTGYIWQVCSDGSHITATNQYGEVKTLKEGSNLWLKVVRTYECEQDQQFQFDKERTQTVIESADPNTGDYQDILGKGHIPLENIPTEHDECPIACLVIHRRTDSTVFSDRTNRVQESTDPETNQREVRLCEKKEDGTYVCPVSDGEVIEQDCGCVDGFGLAATVLQAIHEASKDLICSSSPP